MSLCLLVLGLLSAALNLSDKPGQGAAACICPIPFRLPEGVGACVSSPSLLCWDEVPFAEGVGVLEEAEEGGEDCAASGAHSAG